MEEKIKTYLRADPCAMDLDATYNGRERIADFLLGSGKYILEIKTIKEETGKKHVQAAGSAIQDRPEVPFVYGGAPFEHIIANCADKDEIRAKLVNKIGRKIEDYVRDAEEQILSTKKIYSLHGAYGVLLVINQLDKAIEPSLITRRISQCFKRRSERKSKEKAFQLAIVLDLMHCHAVDGLLGHPIAYLYNNFCFPQNDELHAFFSEYMSRFFGSLGANYRNDFTVKIEDFSNVIQENKNGPSPRYEWWRKQYRKCRYLKDKTDDEVYLFGAEHVETLKKRFVIGYSAEIPSDDEVKRTFELWTHFLEETHIRKLDLKKLKDFALKQGN